MHRSVRLLDAAITAARRQRVLAPLSLRLSILIEEYH